MSSAKDFITTPTAPVSEKAEEKNLDFEVRKTKLFCDTKMSYFLQKFRTFYVTKRTDFLTVNCHDKRHQKLTCIWLLF